MGAEFALPDEYVVIDIETTGFWKGHDKIIEIAAVRYGGAGIIDTFTTLVNPGMPIPEEAVELTGITDADVAAAPEWGEVEDRFLSFVGQSTLVGHNIKSFDIHRINIALGKELSNPLIDTLQLAKAVFPGQPNYKLSTLKEELDLPAERSHRALDDVHTTYALLQKCMASGTIQNFDTSRKHPRPVYSQTKISDIMPADGAARNSALRGKLLVFTGSLRMDRKAAMQIAVDAGAVIRSAVSSKTDYLVVGEQDPNIVGFDGKSDKEKTAHNLNAAGKARIEIIDEEGFLRLASTLDTAIDTPPQECTESYVCDMLRSDLLRVVHDNNVDPDLLQTKEGSAYTSVWYGTQLAFRICCRKGRYYFGVSDAYGDCANGWTVDPSCVSHKGGYTNYSFVPSEDGINCFKPLLAAVFDRAIDTFPKEFDCCSLCESCSDARKCINPHPSIATGCGYRKIMKQGRIFFGENRNVD